MKQALRILYYPLIVAGILLTATEFFSLIVVFIKHMNQYLGFILGLLVYLLIRKIKFIKQNEDFLQTFTHELTHTIVGLCFGHKIHSFKAGQDGGMIYHSGKSAGAMLITLAPYALPIYTIAFMLLRLIGADGTIQVFNFFIGFTFMFHIFCYIRDTHTSQPDLKSQGLIKSYSFIIFSHLFWTSIILVCVWKGLFGGIGYLCEEYWHLMVTAFNAIC